MKLNGRSTKEVFATLQKYSKQRRGPQFVRMVARNLLKLKAPLASIAEVENKQSDDYKEYDEKRTKLCVEMADKDDRGEALMNFVGGKPHSYRIIENKKPFDKAFAKLKEEYADAIEEEKERKADFEEYLDSEKSEEEIQLRSIPFEAIPMKVDPNDPENSELVVEPGDLAVLMEYEIVTDEGDDDKVVSGNFAKKKGSSKKNKSSRKRRA